MPSHATKSLFDNYVLQKFQLTRQKEKARHFISTPICTLDKYKVGQKPKHIGT